MKALLGKALLFGALLVWAINFFTLGFATRGLGSEKIPRNIGICVLNTKTEPVKDTSLIRLAFDSVAYDYMKNVGIEVEIEEYHTYSGKIWTSWWIFWEQLNPNARKLCRKKSYITAILTNSPDVKDLSKIGRANPHKRIILVYNFEKNLLVKTNGNRSFTVVGLEHEIGHVFGLEHSNMEGSFMSGRITNAYWHKAEIEKIKARLAK